MFVDGFVQLGDELGVVVGDFFFEGFAGGVAEGADEGAVEFADAAHAEIGDFELGGDDLGIERDVGWEASEVHVRGDLDFGPEADAGVGLG